LRNPTLRRHVTKKRLPDERPLPASITFPLLSHRQDESYQSSSLRRRKPDFFNSLLDSDLKAAMGGRGVGRLLWLKAFDRASVDSVYIDGDGRKRRRRFTFTARQGVSPNRPSVAEADSTPG